MSEADRPDAFTRLNGMELLQDYVHCKLKTIHACPIARRSQESSLCTQYLFKFITKVQFKYFEGIGYKTFDIVLYTEN